MDYNHSRKAGNRGDVWKHAILMMIADTIPIRNDEFHWFETHAGAPIHRLQTGPFSSDSRQDWRDMAHACTRLGPKKIPFVVWYPCSGSSKPQELVDGTGCAALEVWWDEYAAPQSQSMKGCGMLVSPDLMPIMETAAGELGLLAGALRAQRWGVRYPQRD